ncbi:hypothetical protein CR513_01448, partial [Mucuna pruriens]
METFLRNNSGQGMHNDFSRHRSLDDVPSSKDVQPNSNKSQYTCHNGKIRDATSDFVPQSSDPQAKDPTSSGGSHVETDRRKVISIEATDNPRRFVPQAVTRDIISIVIMRMPTPIEKWKKYPISVKDDLFRDFMDKYKFRSDFDRNMARTVWERTCTDRFSDRLKNERKMALKRVNSKNLADTKGHGPLMSHILATLQGAKLETGLAQSEMKSAPKCRLHEPTP